MIPSALPAALKVVPWRLVGYGAAAAAILVLGWRVSVWKDAHETLPGVQAALDAEKACAEGSDCYARQQALQEAASHATVIAVQGYEAELAAVRARPARVVRLCAPARAGDVRNPDTPAGVDGAGPAAGIVSGPAGPDLGTDLYQLARDADEVAAQLRALQGWNAALAK